MENINLWYYSFHCPLFVADSSAKVFRILFQIHQKDTIERIFKLFKGESINIEGFEDEVVHFLLEIGNNEILSTNFFNKITNENAIKLLELKVQHNIDFSKELQFCSKNFESLKNNISSIDILNLVLDCPFLKLDNEGSLFRFIKRINNTSALPLNTRHIYNLIQKEKSIQYINTDEVDRLRKEIEDKQNKIIILEKSKEENQNDIANLLKLNKEKGDKISICEKIYPAIQHISTISTILNI